MGTLFYLALAIFIATFAIIVSEKIHRTVISLAGAILMILIGVLNQEQAIEGIDFNTLGLLIGMMVVVGIVKECGIFQFIAIWAAKTGKGRPMPIFILLTILTAVFSAFLDNVTTVLLMIPVTFVIANNLKINAKPYLIGIMILSNIGGSATLIGDPVNVLIGSAAKLNFMEFLMNLGPICLILAFVVISYLILSFRKEFETSEETRNAIMRFDPKLAITNYPLLIKSLIVLGIIIIGFFTHGSTGLEGATIALGGAALLLLLTMFDPENHLKEIEWTTIFFFIGLFILVAGLKETGVIGMMATKLLNITGGNLTATAVAILWGSAFFSAIVDNIPFVATMIPLIQEVGVLSGLPLEPFWWALVLGAILGGNATLVGASANVVVSGMAQKEGKKIGFFEYLKLSLPLTFIVLTIATIYLYLRYLM